MKGNLSFRNVGLLAAREAGKVLAKNFRKPVLVRFKKDFTPVTRVDLESETLIQKIIRSRFPSHGIVSEESGGKPGREFTWVVDPLDGTTNYIVGFPFFSVSIALLQGTDPILGIVYNPATRELYVAEKNKGAFLNKKSIQVNEVPRLSRAILSFAKGKDLIGGFRVLAKVVPVMRTIRFRGSSNLDICQVAAGRVAGFLVKKPAYHDTVAGVLIAQEAGGIVSDFQGELYTAKSLHLLVTNKKIYKALLRIIRGN